MLIREINNDRNIKSKWKTDKIRNLFTLNKGLTITKSDLKERGIPVINYGEIHSKYGFRFDIKKHPVLNVDEKYLETNKDAILNQGDFIFSDTSEDIEGSGNFTCYISNEKCFAGYHTVVMKPRNEINYNYYAYFFESLAFRSQIQCRVQGIKVFSITQRILKPLQIILPSEKEQERIVDYLDEKTNRIDDILRDTKQSIQELKKYKQSIITEAVTKGLDSNVEMKDSGIEWIGEVPEAWNVIKTNQLFSIKKEIANKTGYDVLSVTQKGLKVKDITQNEGQMAADYSKYQIVQPDDFVMNHMDLLTGWVDLAAQQGVTSPDYRVFYNKQKKLVLNRFYLYVFQICYLNKIFYGLGQGVSNFGRWRLQTDKFLNFYLPLPEIEEQNEIVSYLDSQIKRIDLLIIDKEKAIEELENYKKSLIYEYVTGKKEL
jgi:type I restriction enzyme, S subunit